MQHWRKTHLLDKDTFYAIFSEDSALKKKGWSKNGKNCGHCVCVPPSILSKYSLRPVFCIARDATNWQEMHFDKSTRRGEKQRLQNEFGIVESKSMKCMFSNA